VTCTILADRELSIEIGLVASLKIKKLRNPNHIGFIEILIPAHKNWLLNCKSK
jgi:hypothetical protein